MISMLIQSLYNIVDGIFVANISDEALTATSISYPAQMLMLAVAVGTGVGINALLSRKLGQRDMDVVNKVATIGLMLSVLSSIVFILFGCFGINAFIGCFTDDAETAAMGVTYLRTCMLLCTGIFLGTTGERLLQATGKTNLSMLAQAAGALVNIILDPILIFGYLGFPEMGILGAAVATVVGQWAAAVISLVLNYRLNKEIHFLFKNFKVDWDIVKTIYKIGIPTMFVQTMTSVMMFLINRIMKGYSATAVATFGVYYKLWTFLYMPMNGLAQGLIPIVGFNYGAKNGERIKQAVKLTAIISFCIMAMGTIVVRCIPAQLLSLYNAGDDMLSIGVPMLKIMCIGFPLVGITLTLGFACSGLGNGVVSMVSTFLRMIVPMVPLVYLLASSFGLDHAWYASWVSEVCAVVFAVLSFSREYRKKVKPILG
jgi:putative MATE family efflux protein